MASRSGCWRSNSMTMSPLWTVVPLAASRTMVSRPLRAGRRDQVEELDRFDQAVQAQRRAGRRLCARIGDHGDDRGGYRQNTAEEASRGRRRAGHGGRSLYVRGNAMIAPRRDATKQASCGVSIPLGGHPHAHHASPSPCRHRRRPRRRRHRPCRRGRPRGSVGSIRRRQLAAVPRPEPRQPVDRYRLAEAMGRRRAQLWLGRRAASASGFPAWRSPSDRIYTMGDQGTSQYVIALAAADGKVLWKTKVGPNWDDRYPGPRATPTVDGALLYTIGTEGDLVCLETATGKERWRKSLVTRLRRPDHVGLEVQPSRRWSTAIASSSRRAARTARSSPSTSGPGRPCGRPRCPPPARTGATAPATRRS